MDRKNTKNGSIYVCYNNNKVQNVWNSCEDDENNYYHVDNDEGLMMMAWPPRSYTCSFCKREFRSAQALGGHMNVHRRDRAQLRQLSLTTSNSSSNYDTTTTINLNLPPSPNPNHMVFSPPTKKPANYIQPLGSITYTSSSSSVIRSSSSESLKRQNHLGGAPPSCRQVNVNVKEFGLRRKEGDSLKKRRGFFEFDLKMNDIDVGDCDCVCKEDLDLELRLGYN